MTVSSPAQTHFDRLPIFRQSGRKIMAPVIPAEEGQGPDLGAAPCLQVIVEHLNDPADWVLVMACLAVVVGVTIKKVAEQPYFGGKKDKISLEEHYIHGEMTTEEYEDRKNHIVALHVRDNTQL